jgi:hypothetical protein
LLQHAVGGVPGQDLVVNREAPSAPRGVPNVVIALAVADEHASSLLQQPDQFRREALAHQDQAAAGRATLNRRANNSTVTWPSAGMQPLASNNAGTMLLSLASRASMVSASVIRPAAFCGVVGYKPTYGKISLGGAKSLSPSLDTLGSFSRTVEDAALCVAVMSGDTELAKIDALSKKPRIATCLTYDAHLASADTVAAIAHAALLAEDLFKVSVPEIKLPAIFKKMSELQGRIMWSESARSFSFEQTHHAEELSQQLRGLIKQGAAITYEQYNADLIVAEQARMSIDQLLSQEFDLVIATSAKAKHKS